jgi:lipid-binding SYLF domain-containing protein
MDSRFGVFRRAAIALAIGLAVPGVAFAQKIIPPATSPPASAHRAPERMSNPNRDEANNASIHLNRAIDVIHTMRKDPRLSALLGQAKGVFITSYDRVALGVGGRGGAGVLLVRNGNDWGQPAFYNFGGVSAGLEAGIEGGRVAFVLNNQRALDSFKQDNNWSLNADAGLTIAAWSRDRQASAGKGDVTVWSGTKGLFGAAAVSLTDVNYDEGETTAYYGASVAVADIIDGRVSNPHQAELRQALASAGQPTSLASSNSMAKSTSSAGESRKGSTHW